MPGLRDRSYRFFRRLARGDLSTRDIDTSESASRQRLRQTLEHAAAHVPYYSRWLAGSDLESLEGLPVLTKRSIRDHFEELKADDLGERSWFSNSSGGSTGSPITLIQEEEFRRWYQATADFFYETMLGIDPVAARKVVLWGSEADIFGQAYGWKNRMRDWLLRTTPLNSFRMTPEALSEYVAVINRERPDVVRGYAGSLHEVAEFARNHGLHLHRPAVVVSAAETLRPFMRESIESAFGCKVHDFYGSREVGSIAAECVRGAMHVFAFNNLVEVVDDGGRPVAPGQSGRVLVTTLHNRSMPLLRYDIGDTATGAEPCDCGVALPTIGRITGRVTDHFVAEDGTLVHGEYFTHLFYFKGWLSEFQVLQTHFDRVEIHYVPSGTPPDEDVRDIEKKIRMVLGEGCAIEWNPIDSVPRTPHGKLLFTRSLVHAATETREQP